MAPSRLQIVDSEAEAPQTPKQDNSIAISMMTMALSALSQRALTAAASLFTLLTIASVFALAWVMPDPNILQLTKLGMYSAFVVIVNVVVRKSK